MPAASQPKLKEPNVDHILRSKGPLTSGDLKSLMKAVDYWEYVQDISDDRYDGDVLENVTKELEKIEYRIAESMRAAKRSHLSLVKSKFHRILAFKYLPIEEIQKESVMSFLKKVCAKEGEDLLDKAFAAYVFKEGKGDLDGVAAQLQKAMAQGNGEYIKKLMKKFNIKKNDLMSLASELMEFHQNHP